MGKLSSITAKQAIRALKRAGFVEDRQKGSHLILIHPMKQVRTVIPVHAGRTIKEPLMRSILKDAELSIEKFIDLL